MEQHGEHHMYDLVGALVRAGSSFKPRPGGWSSEPFWPTKADQVCHLESPIDFAVARAVPGQPEELEFDEDSDTISCRACWMTITGADHRPEWERVRPR
ncbi:hypothetical protein ACFWAR_37085 [Streptomyces sp. NPDC059917]|uniref:hypothetical protein n=1 Tax=Streptomyces sp. NPDC059917 TaxID=3347002 RepID=UPI00364E47DB